MREIDGVWVYLIPEKEPMEKDGKQYLRWSFRIGRRQPSKSRPSKDFITNAQIRAAIEEDRASLGLEKPRYGKIVGWITVEYDPATRTATWKQYNPLAREEDRNDTFKGKGIAQAFDDFVMGKAKKKWPAIKWWAQLVGLPPRKEQLRKRGIKTLAPSDAPLPNGKVEIGYKASHFQARTALKKKMLGDALKARGQRKPR